MATNNSFNTPDRAKLEGFEITFKNFAGRETNFNRAGNRNFSVVLDDDTADQMKAEGWNVRIKEYDDGSRRNTLQVAVRYDIDRFRPKVVMVTPKGDHFKKTVLSEDTVDQLDGARVVSADLILNPSSWRNAMGNSGIKAYLQTGYFVVEADEFENKYGDDDEFEDDSEVPF